MDNSEELNGTQVTDNSQPKEDATHIERLKQQLHWREEQAKKEAERAANLEKQMQTTRQTQIKREYSRVYKNGNLDVEEFKSLLETDAELADSVAKQFTLNGNPIGSAKEIIEYYGVNEGARTTLDKEVLKKELFKEFKAQLEQEGLVKSAKWMFSNLPEGKQEQAEAYFNKITWGRNLSESEAKEFAEMASFYVMKDAMIESARSGKDNRIASMAAMSFGNNSVNLNTSQQKSDDAYSDEDMIEWLSTYAPKTSDNAKMIQAISKK